MTELFVASACAYENPTVFFKQLDEPCDFYAWLNYLYNQILTFICPHDGNRRLAAPVDNHRHQ